MLKKAFLLSSLVFSVPVFAQTTFLPLGSEDYHIMDRLETRSGRLCDSLSNGDKPETRRNAVYFLETVKAKNDVTAKGATPASNTLTNIDRYNLDQMISESGEWTPDTHGAINSKHPIFNAFYKKQYDMVNINTEDFLFDKNFFVVINPVTANSVMMQRNSPQPTGLGTASRVLYSSRGAELRGWIGKIVGFYTSITDNQEQFPYYVYNNAGKKLSAVPGADYFLRPGGKFGTYDYMQATGYVNFDVVKNHINTTFGFGKHFIGDGISSLFLTDNSSSMPYLQIQTRIWKINYECLFLELTPQYDNYTGDQNLSHKFSSIHYLTANVNRWLNLGLFEADVFDRPNNIEISYLNPIIFTTAINRFNGSGDKSLLGFSAKAIAAKHVQLYTQVVVNEFRYKEIIHSKGWYGNKYGIQMGAKYFDAFTIKNLDLQGEIDAVRPYTYTAQDTLANYTNYNQPLADPLGAGFIKAIGVIKYQPCKNLYLTAKATYYMQGADTGNSNFGNNVFKDYTTANHQYGVSMVNGPKNTCQILSLNASYQLRRNLFVDLGGVYRKYVNAAGVYPNSSTVGDAIGPLTTNYVYFGIRINAPRREYDFF
ncbi:MAG: hypothetical protein JWQ38_238 [Flavipsychrobacter sp.]|nr:hypothetical protein [Flavipsychrobacter sp.]